MRSCLLAMRLALTIATILLPIPVIAAQDTPSHVQSTAQADPSLARKALGWSRDRLAELDATIIVLERQEAKLSGDLRTKADESLKALRDQRDTYRIKAEEAAASVKTWSDNQVSEAQKALDKNWTRFQAERDQYLETTKADLATRRAILEAELEARKKSWQAAIDDLHADAQQLAVDQQTAIDARIAALKVQIVEGEARLGQLQDASAEAWATAKKGYEEAQKLFSDTYASIRKSIEDGIRK